MMLTEEPPEFHSVLEFLSLMTAQKLTMLPSSYHYKFRNKTCLQVFNINVISPKFWQK